MRGSSIALSLKPRILIESSRALRQDSRKTILVFAVETSWVRHSILTDSGVTASPRLFLAAGLETLGRVPVTVKGAGGAEKVVGDGEKVIDGTDWKGVVETVDRLGEENAGRDWA